MQRSPLLVLVLGAAAWSLPLPAQCQDPRPPAGGFPIVQQLDQIVTYQDSTSTKTKIDIFYPQQAPGACGWPVVIDIHGFGANRKQLTADGQRWAKRGFLAALYDVRGQGEVITLNVASGTTAIGKEERLDMVEIIAWLKTTYGSGGGPRADLNRIGVTGYSQGAIHSWAAAAWSGKALPPNSRGLTTFPKIGAIAPWDFPPLTGDVMVPQGKVLLGQGIAAIFLVPSAYVRWDPAWIGGIQPLYLAENFAGVSAYFDTDPFRNDLQGLATSTVPVLFTGAWNDQWASMNYAQKALAAMPSTTSKRAFYDAHTLYGHGTPGNNAQTALFYQLTERWFGRFLKGESNGVENEAPFVATVIAESQARYLNASALAWNRHHDTWPPAATSAQRYYLHQGNALNASSPTGAETSDVVVHTVATSFGINQFINSAFTQPGATKSSIPLSSIAYDSAPLAKDMEIAGSAKVRLEVTPSFMNYQVHCALFQVNASGERFLGNGLAAIRDPAATPRQIDVDVIALDVRLLAGDKLRLRIENLTERNMSPLYDDLWVAPYFQSSTVNIEHSLARPSWLDLPVRTIIQPSLASSTTSVNPLVPVAVQYAVEGPGSLGGNNYFVAFGLSGTATRNPIYGSDPLRLTIDSATLAFLSAGAPLVVGTSGILSPAGLATATLNLPAIAPLPPALLGMRLSAAGVVQLGASNFLQATNPVDVVLQ